MTDAMTIKWEGGDDDVDDNDDDEDDDWEVNKEASLRSDNPLVVCLLIWLMVWYKKNG